MGFRSTMILTIILSSMREIAASEYGSELDYYQELPVVLSASRLSQLWSESPNTITVLNCEMIVASNFRNIANLNNGILAASKPNDSASPPYTQRQDERWRYSAAYYYQSAMLPFDRGAVVHQPIQRRTDMRIVRVFHAAGELSGA